ncbi:MAG: NADH:ubiquinone oxidoreductase [Chloroflexi bacterium CFX4]|nr:NADH:ubiquinone oxidoreductase [Chloroflexi bacterium CFX4]MDL1921584.1 NADH:ubiquinone oxidoreductase [Chloroflexi bacterium CFX3]
MSAKTLPRIAFFEFTSCEGCQLTVVDTLQDHPELLNAVEIVQFREAMSERGDNYQIAFIEGSCTRPSDEAKLKEIRAKAQIVVALGACAHLGGVNAIRNRMALPEVREYVYGEKAAWFETYPARPIEAVIKVDASLPGCPIDRNEFAMAVTHLLQGRLPNLPDYPLCIECKLLENVCMYQRGKTCLGPITRAGCAAICPSYGDGCEGCRGLIPKPNWAAMKAVLREHGMTDAEIDSRLTMFLTYQTMQLEAKAAEG